MIKHTIIINKTQEYWCLPAGHKPKSLYYIEKTKVDENNYEHIVDAAGVCKDHFKHNMIRSDKKPIIKE